MATPFMKRKSTPYIFGGAILLIVLIAVYFSGKKAGKGNRPKSKPLPTGGEGIPIVGRDSDGNPISWDPEPLAKELYSVMEGILDTEAEQEGTFGKALALTDDQLTALYNRFNALYYDEDEATLTEWIDAEWWKGPKGTALLEKLRHKNLPYGGANWGVYDPLSQLADSQNQYVGDNPIGGSYVQYQNYAQPGDPLDEGCGCGCGGTGMCQENFNGIDSYDLTQLKRAYSPERRQLRAKSELLSRRLKRNGLT